MTARTIQRRVSAPAGDFAPRLHPVLRRVYAARGVNDEGTLGLGLDRLLPVSSLEGLEGATELLLRHRASGRRILVVGDFDADGATSSALVVRCLRKLGFSDAGFLVPNRFKYGYGLTPEIVALASQQQPSLIITVDNGISSQAGVAEANRRGIEVLVTDHHLPGTELPAAAAIVNPNLPQSRFGSRALAGVGVAFYLMAALTRRMQQQSDPVAATVNVADVLDLVALGTVADLVQLDHNNRILVAHGLKRIRARRCVPGIVALLQEAKRDPARIVAQDLGFAVAPRLNAAGRLDDMSIGIECLLTDDEQTARSLAARLSQLNEERREIEQRMQEEAATAVRKVHIDSGGELASALCLYDESWHQGVVGLVASRIKDRVHRPVVAFARAEEAVAGRIDSGSGIDMGARKPGTSPILLRGSARSVPGVHIRDVLDAVATRYPDLIEKFGGHAMAAGLTLKESALTLFTTALIEESARWFDAGRQGIIESDGELSPEEMTLATAFELRDGGPWGQGFPEPAFDGEFAVIDTRVVGERHLKLRVRACQSGEILDAIAFRYFEHAGAADGAGGSAAAASAFKLKFANGTARLAYRLDVNEYLGARRLQLIVEHIC